MKKLNKKELKTKFVNGLKKALPWMIGAGVSIGTATLSYLIGNRNGIQKGRCQELDGLYDNTIGLRAIYNTDREFEGIAIETAVQPIKDEEKFITAYKKTLDLNNVVTKNTDDEIIHQFRSLIEKYKGRFKE